jgi:hypothetical protein
MPIVNPSGNEDYWGEGLPFKGVQKTSSPPDPGSEDYWFDGLPADFLLSAASVSAPTKTQVIFI